MMKSSLVPIFLVTAISLLSTASGWDFTVYSSEALYCGDEWSGPLDRETGQGNVFPAPVDYQYTAYTGHSSNGTGTGIYIKCIEAGQPVTDYLGDCTFFTRAGHNSAPCTGPMVPSGASILTGKNTKCEWYTNTAGLGNSNAYEGGCAPSDKVEFVQQEHILPHECHQLFNSKTDKDRENEIPGRNNYFMCWDDGAGPW